MYTPRYDLALHLDAYFKDKPPSELVDLISAMRMDLLDYYEDENREKDPYAKTKNILLRIADLDLYIKAVWQFFCNNYFSFFNMPKFIMTKATLKKHMGLWPTELNKCRDLLYRVLHGTHLRHRTEIAQFLKEHMVDGLNIVDEKHEIIRRYLELFCLDLKEPDPEDEI